ncbi:MAG TPA: type II toxin-antitoxin system RelE/ParE family toxin [Stellaceae bacterium]|nr:type II toxin-antitoxin system RelE/ParE family toxin [Stellaceae bacterium]
MITSSWQVDISLTAANDIQGIISWTRRRFGPPQAVEYGEVIDAALTDLRSGPAILGVKERSEVGSGYYTMHVARGGRRGRHLILFRVRNPAERIVVVVRVLHDAMDLLRHIPPDNQEDEV